MKGIHGNKLETVVFPADSARSQSLATTELFVPSAC